MAPRQLRVVVGAALRVHRAACNATPHAPHQLAGGWLRRHASNSTSSGSSGGVKEAPSAEGPSPSAGNEAGGAATSSTNTSSSAGLREAWSKLAAAAGGATGLAGGAGRFVTKATEAMLQQAQQGLQRAGDTSAGRAAAIHLEAAWSKHATALTLAGVALAAWLTYTATAAAAASVAGLSAPARAALTAAVLAAAGSGAWALRRQPLRAAALLAAVAAGWQAADVVVPWLLELSPEGRAAALAVASIALAAWGAAAIRNRTRASPERVHQLAMLKLHSNAGVLEVLGAPLEGASDLALSLVSGGGTSWRGLQPRQRPQRVQMLFPVQGRERRGTVSVEASKARGKYRFDLLAVEVAAQGREPAGRLMLHGNPAAMAGSLGALATLRPAFAALAAAHEQAARAGGGGDREPPAGGGEAAAGSSEAQPGTADQAGRGRGPADAQDPDQLTLMERLQQGAGGLRSLWPGGRREQFTYSGAMATKPRGEGKEAPRA